MGFSDFDATSGQIGFSCSADDLFGEFIFPNIYVNSAVVIELESASRIEAVLLHDVSICRQHIHMSWHNSKINIFRETLPAVIHGRNAADQRITELQMFKERNRIE